ncbi:MAG TPA: hypothetical protein PKV72_04380 [Candidatus Peribacteria bacterium]|nr:hypothetical protein [Candidatus Peribacteria bacterium]
MHNYFTTYTAQTLRRAGLVLGFMAVAFAVGIQTAGDVRPLVEPTRAGIRLSGDMDGNDVVNAADARLALEVARGYREATLSELEADTNQDFRITMEDVSAILEMLERR